MNEIKKELQYLYKCLYCGEGYVSIYGRKCFTCEYKETVLELEKVEDGMRLVWKIFMITVAIVAAAGLWYWGLPW